MKARSGGSSATVQARADSYGWVALVHVVAVKIHAGLQAQRVARAQTAGGDPEGVQAAPRRYRVRRRHHDLEAVLAGVAGARHEPGAQFAAENTSQRQRRGGLGRGEQLRGLGARLGTLHGEHRQIRALAHFDAEGLRVATDPGEVLVARAGIHHHAKPVLAQVIDDEIIEDAAVLLEHAAVERLAGQRQLGDVVGEQVPQQGAHALAASGRPRTCARRRTRLRRAAPRGARRSASRTAPACPSRRNRRCGRPVPGAV